jgi:hypothetical protein
VLSDLVDGEHFFDIVTDDTVYEVLYDLGWPRVIRGRTDLMAAFRGYVDNIALVVFHFRREDSAGLDRLVGTPRAWAVWQY